MWSVRYHAEVAEIDDGAVRFHRIMPWFRCVLYYWRSEIGVAGIEQ